MQPGPIAPPVQTARQFCGVIGHLVRWQWAIAGVCLAWILLQGSVGFGQDLPPIQPCQAALAPDAELPGPQEPLPLPAPGGPEVSAGNNSPATGRCPECGALEPGAYPLGPEFQGLPAGPLAEWLGGPPQPLLREDWRYRPFSAGWFMGVAQGSSLVDDWVSADQGFFGGYRLGWDLRRWWGCETRFAFGHMRVGDSQRAIDAQQSADDARHIDPLDPFRRRFDAGRDMRVGFWDIDLVYYPFGETVWRPYLMVGVGLAKLEFADRLSHHYDDVMFALPVAVGVKRRVTPWLALRFELADTMAFPDDIDINAVHTVSFTGAMEVRFGGTRKAYWPWNPGRHYW